MTAAINGANIGQALGIGILSGLVSYGVGSFVGAGVTDLWGPFWGGVIGGGFGGAAGGATAAGLYGGDAGTAALAGLAGGALGGTNPLIGPILGGAASAEIAGGEAWEGALGGLMYVGGSIAGNALASGDPPAALNIDMKDGMAAEVGSRNLAGPAGWLGAKHRFIRLQDGTIIEMGASTAAGMKGKIEVFKYKYDPNAKLAGTPGHTTAVIKAGKVDWASTTVSRSAMNTMVANYAAKWAGTTYYQAASHNSNYFVNTVVYGAGGQVPGEVLGWTPGFPNWEK